MSGIYWYISHEKIEALLKDYAPRKTAWFKELSIKLKVPGFAEASAKIEPNQSLYSQVEKIRQKLIDSPETPRFPNLPSENPLPFFLFGGRAHRSVDSGAYWVVMLDGSTALLMAGSVHNAIGSPSSDAGRISPSVDPIGAVNQAFGGDRSLSVVLDSVSAQCSYVWQTIARPVRKSWEALPKVEGIAVFAGAFPASRGQFSRAGFDGVQTIVVGSPVYVQQI